MRKSAYPAAAIVASVALLTVGAPTASQAQTEKELSICWVNKTPNPVTDLEVVADGPSYKSASLDAGECAAWDVRPGQYTLTLEDIEEFLVAATDQSDCESLDTSDYEWYPDLTITIKRQQETYRAYPQLLVTNGKVTTNVKKDRRTSVTVLLKCVSVLVDNP